MVLVGQPAANAVLMMKMRPHYVGKTMLDSQGGLTNPSVDIPRYAMLYLAGRLPVSDFVTDHYSLTDVNKAMARVRTGQAGRVALWMNSHALKPKEAA